MSTSYGVRRLVRTGSRCTIRCGSLPLPLMPICRARSTILTWDCLQDGEVEDIFKRDGIRMAAQYKSTHLPLMVLHLTAWTILQHDDPCQLGLRCNALNAHQMALITSGCVPFRCCTRSGRPSCLLSDRCGHPTADGLSSNKKALTTSDCDANYSMSSQWP